MIWEFNYLFVHVAALAGVWLLYPTAPDAIQKLCLLILAAAILVYIGADIAALCGADPVWPIRLVASRIEHSAMLIYIFRQIWIKSEICQFLKSFSSLAK
jgi:hypothetical protein